MVARLVQAFSAADLRTQLGLSLPMPLTPRYNIAPTQPLLVVRRTKTSAPREPWPMRWGLIPAWAKAPGATLATARLEDVADNPAYRTPLRRRRGVVPASGWYVWRQGETGKYPVYHHASPAVLPMAAVWENWQGADGSDVDTVAILTRPADGPPASRDERVPVLLRPQDLDAWLDPFQEQAPQALRLLIPPYEPPILQHAVHPKLANPDVDDATLIAPRRAGD